MLALFAVHALTRPDELTRGAGTQFDPQVVAAFLDAFEERNAGARLDSPAAVRSAAR